MFFFFKLLCVAVLGYLDRFRGSDRLDIKKAVNGIDTLVFGMVIALLIGVNSLLLAAALAVLWLIGERPGWGEPIGTALHPERTMRPDHLEWWQIGLFARSVPMALLLRGLIWGAPTLILLPWVPAVATIPPAMAIAFFAAPYIARKFCSYATQWSWPLPPTDKGIWDKMEAIRGWLFGLLLLIFNL